MQKKNKAWDFGIKWEKGAVPLMPVIAFLIAALYFFVSADGFLRVESEAKPNNSVTGEISRDVAYRQDVICDRDYLQAIKLFITTYGRVNHGSLEICLSDDEGVIQSWVVDCGLLRDNAYRIFQLDHKVRDSKDKRYHISVSSDANAGQGVAVYGNNAEDADGLFLNGAEVDKQSLCYQMVYAPPLKELWKGANGFHVNVFILLSICIMVFLYTAPKARAESCFLVIWCLLSAMFLFSSTLFNVPDEEAHFFRAYEVSYHHMVSEFNEGAMAGGRELPLDVDLGKLEESWQTFAENKGMEASDNFVFKGFSNTSVYSPVSYLPQAIGIFISRHITGNVAVIAYSGRIFNWVLITIILYLAIKIIPFGKAALALIALMPMNIHEAVSLAPDGMVVAISVFMVAYALKLKYDDCEEKLTVGQIVLLYILAMAISQYKIVYLPFCLAFFLIPTKRFGGMKKKMCHATVMAILAGGLSLLWLKSGEQFLVIYGTDSNAQFSYAFSHPIHYFLVLCRTYFNALGDWVLRSIGNSLNELNVPVSTIVIMAYLIMMALHFLPQNKEKADKILKTVFSIIIISVAVLISTSIYLQWTAVYEMAISGIQGRYFIALMLPLYFVMNNSESGGEPDALSVNSYSVVVLANMCACVSILTASLGH